MLSSEGNTLFCALRDARQDVLHTVLSEHFHVTARNASAELGRLYVLPEPSVLAVGPLPWPRSSPRSLPSQCW